jgi:hypothetical protein
MDQKKRRLSAITRQAHNHFGTFDLDLCCFRLHHCTCPPWLPLNAVKKPIGMMVTCLPVRPTPTFKLRMGIKGNAKNSILGRENGPLLLNTGL